MNVILCHYIFMVNIQCGKIFLIMIYKKWCSF